MRRLASLAAVVLVLFASQAEAQEPTGVRSCDLTLSGVAFGIFSGPRIDTTGTIVLDCRGNGNNNPFAISLSEGNSHSFLERRIFDDVNHLSYNLYIDPAHSRIWGSGAGETRLFIGALDFRQLGSIQERVTVYARIPAQTIPAPGHYSDLIVVTVSF